MEAILKIVNEKPDEKVGLAFHRGKQSKHDLQILVVSQWTACLALVSRYLEERDVIHVKYVSQCSNTQNKAQWMMFDRYQGDMKRSERDKAVREFMTGVDARVMLLSLKCGGMNVTAGFRAHFLMFLTRCRVEPDSC